MWAACQARASHRRREGDNLVTEIGKLRLDGGASIYRALTAIDVICVRKVTSDFDGSSISGATALPSSMHSVARVVDVSS